MSEGQLFNKLSEKEVKQFLVVSRGIRTEGGVRNVNSKFHSIKFTDLKKIK
jgi:hypothetical protein